VVVGELFVCSVPPVASSCSTAPETDGVDSVRSALTGVYGLMYIVGIRV
jgi:hypothetical protein